MALTDDLASLKPSLPKGTCTLGWILTQLDAETAAALIQALERNAEGTAVARVLGTHGHQISADAVRRHGRTIRGEQGGCKCE